MAICIYCGTPGQMSREHFLPVCLGNFRNCEPLTDKLCKACNERISVLEEQFCRCGPEAFYRIYLGIEGRKYHKRPSPFYRGSAGGKRIEIKSKHPTLDLDIYCELEPGTDKTVPARQIIVQDRHGKFHPILIDEYIKEPDDLKNELEKRGLADARFVECWSKDTDEDLLKRFCSIFKEEVNWSDTVPYDDTEKQIHVATISVTSSHFRSIAKIAFHYFLKNFSHFSGFEEEFRGIKDLIINCNDVDKWVRQVQGFFVEDLKHSMTTSNYCHLLGVDKNPHKISTKVQFFVGPKGTYHYYEVLIGRNPETIYYPQSIGHQFVYFDKPDQDGFVGRMDPLRTIRRELLP